MSLPIGIGNFATGLVQGMRQRKEDDRQAEADAMRKQEFGLQQEARTFDLQNARKTAGRQDEEYARTQGIQQKQDAFTKGFDASYSALKNGDELGAMTSAEALLNDPQMGLPHKVMLVRDAAGNPVKGPNGYTMNYMDQSGKVVSTASGDADSILGNVIVAKDAIGHYNSEKALKAKAAEKAVDQAFDLKKIELTGAQRIKAAQVQSESALKAVREKARLGIAGAGGKLKMSLSPSGLDLLKDYTTAGKDEEGNPIIKPVLNTQKLGSFQRWAKDNNVPPNDEYLQAWLSNSGPAASEDPAIAPASIDFSELE